MSAFVRAEAGRGREELLRTNLLFVSMVSSKIVQRGLDLRKLLRANHLCHRLEGQACKLLILLDLLSWLLRLDSNQQPSG